MSDSQRTALQAEFSQITAEIDRIGSNTTYNGAQVFGGSAANVNQAVGSGTVPAGLTAAVAGTITVSAGGNAIFTSAGGEANVGALINEINNSKTGGLSNGLVATLNASGQLLVTDTLNRGTATNPLTVAGTGFKINAEAAAKTFANPNTLQHHERVLERFNGCRSSSIGVTLSTFSSSNMNGISLANDNLSTSDKAQTALTDINNAISQVAALRGQIGASVNRLQSASNVISNQVQNLTSAENGIMAADIPSTVANLTKYSILEQTGISSLAQANQQQQLVLKLLQ